AAREGDAPQRRSLSAFVSVLLALEDADHLPRSRTILHSHRRSPRERARRDQRCALDSALGREPHFGYGGIAARLGDLASAQLGRAAARLLFGGSRSDSRAEMDPQTRRSGGATRLGRPARA